MRNPWHCGVRYVHADPRSHSGWKCVLYVTFVNSRLSTALPISQTNRSQQSNTNKTMKHQWSELRQLTSGACGLSLTRGPDTVSQWDLRKDKPRPDDSDSRLAGSEVAYIRSCVFNNQLTACELICNQQIQTLWSLTYTATAAAVAEWLIRMKTVLYCFFIRFTICFIISPYCAVYPLAAIVWQTHMFQNIWIRPFPHTSFPSPPLPETSFFP